MDRELTKEEKRAELIANTEKLYTAVWNELERQKKVKIREDKLKSIFRDGK